MAARKTFWGQNDGIGPVVAARRVLVFDLFLRNFSYRAIGLRLGISCTAVMRHLKRTIGDVDFSAGQTDHLQARRLYFTVELWRLTWPNVRALEAEAKAAPSQVQQGRYFGRNANKEIEAAFKRFYIYDLFLQGYTFEEIGEDVGTSAPAVGRQLRVLAGRAAGKRRRRPPSMRDLPGDLSSVALELLQAAYENMENQPDSVQPLFELVPNLRYAQPFRAVSMRPRRSERRMESHWGINAGTERLIRERRKLCNDLHDAGFTYREIAQRVRISPTAVFGHVKAARASGPRVIPDVE